MFDEATSALDAHTETAIMTTINDFLDPKPGRSGKTGLFIAHRLSSIMDCDLIYVLVEGKVVEKGSHEELVTMDGVYAGMWASQQGVREDEDECQ